MEETKNKRVRGPRIYMGAPAELVAQLKIIASKKNTHVSVLLLSKAYDLIEEYEHLLKDGPAATMQNVQLAEAAQADEEALDLDGDHIAPNSECDIWEPLGETEDRAEAAGGQEEGEEHESVEASVSDEPHAGDHFDQHGESETTSQQQKGIFEGVRALWKKNTV
ncbi:hypothetical protein [Paraburkholderia tropica]|uniref:hypothetical protein n=1 Tax=Paraburkholderia tropica TaxID=92647 RepID=UPI002AB13E0A|nr:hypothetical protein [Paraburkholderia tropica]